MFSLPRWSLPLTVLDQRFVCMFHFPMPAACPAHLVKRITTLLGEQLRMKGLAHVMYVSSSNACFYCNVLIFKTFLIQILPQDSETRIATCIKVYDTLKNCYVSWGRIWQLMVCLRVVTFATSLSSAGHEFYDDCSLSMLNVRYISYFYHVNGK